MTYCSNKIKITKRIVSFRIHHKMLSISFQFCHLALHCVPHMRLSKYVLLYNKLIVLVHKSHGHIIWEQKHDFLFLLTLVTDTFFTISNNDDFGKSLVTENHASHKI